MSAKTAHTVPFTEQTRRATLIRSAIGAGLILAGSPDGLHPVMRGACIGAGSSLLAQAVADLFPVRGSRAQRGSQNVPKDLAALRQALSRTPMGGANRRASTPKAGGTEDIVGRFLVLDPRDVPDDLLVGVLIAGSTRKAPLVEARRILDDVDGRLENLVDERRADLGLSETGQARFVAAAEIARRAAARRSTEAARRRERIESSTQAVEILRGVSAVGAPVESLAALFTNVRQEIIAVRTLTRGVAAATIVDPSQIARTALRLGATGVILAHNHPSGSPEPSPDDVAVTRLVRKVLDAVGVRLVDHIVLTPDRYVSIRQRGHDL